jgi:hypothetical protein
MDISRGDWFPQFCVLAGVSLAQHLVFPHCLWEGGLLVEKIKKIQKTQMRSTKIRKNQENFRKSKKIKGS